MKIGVLTSSRADYGIYKPLLDKLKSDDRFDLTIIAFGMHLLKEHGNTIDLINADRYSSVDMIGGMPIGDSPREIVVGYGQLIREFGEYWSQNEYDWVFALGDRFEMSAAIQSGIPFLVNFAHIHGGETTLGAIDNVYRHQISLASKLHFVAASNFKLKLENLLGDLEGVHNVGSLSLDALDLENLPKWKLVAEKFQIPPVDFVLVTFHPETVEYDKNEVYASIIEEVLLKVSHEIHVVITLANADTMGKLFRDMAFRVKEMAPESISIVHNFGKDNYFSAMKASKFLLGNTSSGIIEAASFGKNVINVGNRQKGRLRSNNVFDLPFQVNEIINVVRSILADSCYVGENVYKQNNTAERIINVLINETV